MPRASRRRDAANLASFVGVAVLAVSTAAALLLVDTRAEAAFDAPKRLIAMIGVGIAAVAAVSAIRGLPTSADVAHRIILSCAITAIVLIIASALLSPRRMIALDALRPILLLSAVPLIAAAPLVSRSVWKAVTIAFLAASTVNAVVSLAQTVGVIRMFHYATIGGRANTSALIGNDGVLALTMAFAALLAVERVLFEERAPLRSVYTVVLGLTLAALITNRSLTPMLSFGAGAAVLVLMRIRHAGRVLTVTAIALLVAILAMFAFAPMRERLNIVASSLADRDWNRLTTYRFGPWAAALEMARSRPLLGFGPGTYGAEFAPHFIGAEVRWRRRLVNPVLVGSYAEAHSEYLQSIAEVGVPAVVLLIIAIGGTVYVTLRNFSSVARLPVAIAIAGMVAALTWFPLRQPALAILILSALGRSWHISAESRSSEQ